MMAIGNREFVTVMRLCGLAQSFEARTGEEALHAFQKAKKGELVVMSAGLLSLASSLQKEYNIVSLPDKLEDFSSLDDLNAIIVSAVGSGFELEED
ncbi:hypothetical protein COV93_06180 [Candidatus Woesearchaeota archaeon CG11_big_fil_rev_8_21_14_0_20_43_8]|nr:MAG: hypothetical protein COV93_06180 [Candidatus Woesearchaeota archaeon CG11_big_fil_rev_8_21_14_0_20_43_8]PIO05409.1 MAG: hypothetical protein COT47_04950 [Candidatus Woesearchaeota archaeon CG08_land_8_20_14_0_20_43_7]